MRAISMTSPVKPGAGRMQTIVPLLIPPLTCFPHSMVTMGIAIVNVASLLFNYCVINSGTTARRVALAEEARRRVGNPAGR